MLLCRKSCEKFLLDISGIYVIIRGSLRDTCSYGGVAHLGVQGKQLRTPNQKTKYVLFKHSNPYGGIAQLGEQVTSKATRNRNAASKKLISRKSSKIKGFRFHGGIAQLGERLNGIQEVSGSIPLISTNNRP